MGEATHPTITIQEATVDDIRDMAVIFLRGLSWDPLARAFDKVMSFDAQVEGQMQRQIGRLTAGHELGACRTWKVVDENGKMVAWGGLGVPKALTEEQKQAIQGKFPDLPPNFPEGLLRCIITFEAELAKCLEKHGYDPALHYMRQSTMVDKPYQRKGIGRMITRKCNEIADEAGAVTFVRARPSSKPLFEQEGYRVLEEIPMDYERFGIEGQSAVFVMKREPRGK